MLYPRVRHGHRHTCTGVEGNTVPSHNHAASSHMRKKEISAAAFLYARVVLRMRAGMHTDAHSRVVKLCTMCTHMHTRKWPEELSDLIDHLNLCFIRSVDCIVRIPVSHVGQLRRRLNLKETTNQSVSNTIKPQRQQRDTQIRRVEGLLMRS